MNFFKRAGAAAMAAVILGGTAFCALPCFGTSVVNAAVNLSINKNSANLGVGEAIKLTANTKVTWRTSNSALATVDANGNVKTKAVGTVWITGKASDGTEKACKITVKAAPKKVTITKGLLTLGVGEKYTLGSNIDAGAACSKRTYRTSDSSIVKMTRTDWQGEFTAVKTGTAWVTVRTYNGKEASCKITVKAAPKSVKTSKGIMTLRQGDKATLTAIVPDGAGCATRTFRTSNSSVVKMTRTNWQGEFTAVNPGTAYVTVRTYNGKEACCKVTVTKYSAYDRFVDKLRAKPVIGEGSARGVMKLVGTKENPKKLVTITVSNDKKDKTVSLSYMDMTDSNVVETCIFSFDFSKTRKIQPAIVYANKKTKEGFISGAEIDTNKAMPLGSRMAITFYPETFKAIDYKDILNPRAKVLTGEAGCIAGIKSVEIYSIAVRAWDDLAKKQLGMYLDDISFPTFTVLEGVK